MSPAKRLPVQKTYKLYIGGKFPRTESGRHSAFRDQQGNFVANLCLASRKDMRNAVVAARAAQPGWAKASAFLRGQILYRLAEMLEKRSAQFVEELIQAEGLTPYAAKEQVEEGIDLCVYVAGWTDKFQQIHATVNPVASPHFNFSVPEPMGVVGICCPQASGFLGLLRAVLPVIAGGNTAVVLASESSPLCAITLSEAMATADFPGGVVNILTGTRSEILPQLRQHMDVNALSVWEATPEEKQQVYDMAEDNLKRLFFPSGKGSPGHYALLDFQETKTTWHPVGL